MADLLDKLLHHVRAVAALTPDQARTIEHDLRRLHGGCEVYIRKPANESRGLALQQRIEAALQRGTPISEMPSMLGCGRRVIYKHLAKRQRPR